MTSSWTTDGVPVPDYLHVGYGRDRPDVSDLQVFAETETTLCGARFRVAVIGSSHYVHAPDAGFHEIVSCKPIDHDAVHELDLREYDDRTLSFAGEDLSCETTVETRPLESVPDPEKFALAHTFGEDAVTAIGLGTDRYETYHTYPEFDCVVYTETRLERV
jgi:hypothetical protein